MTTQNGVEGKQAEKVGRRSRVQAKIAAILLLLFAGSCRKSQPPSGDLAFRLEECDPAGYVSCIPQSALLSVPIADTNLFLTYSSDWKAGAEKTQEWDASSLGIGGWSLNVVNRYDAKHHVLIEGNGTWRITDSVALPSGEFAVPSFDGSRAYIFDASGHHVRTVDGRLGMELVQIRYDASGRLASVEGSIDNQPIHLEVQTDAGGQASKLVGIDGAATSLRMDANERLIAIYDPSGDATDITWGSEGLVASKSDAMRNTVQFTYDAAGHLASAADEDGVTKQYSRTNLSNGVEVSVTTALGRKSVYRSELEGTSLRRTAIAPDATTNSETIDEHGNRKITLADGRMISVNVQANPVWGWSAPLLTPVVETRPDGVQSRHEVKFEAQAQSKLPYSLTGSIITTTNGQAWVETLDPGRRADTLVDPAGRRSVSIYDEQGRLLQRSAPRAAPLSYTYNAQGRIESMTVGAGKTAQTTRYSYDSQAGTITATLADGTTQQFKYDKHGRLASVVAGDGSTSIVSFNAAGRVLQFQAPGGLSYVMGASRAGKLMAFAPPSVENDSSIETRSYDGDGELERIEGWNHQTVQNTYDGSGRIASVQFDQGKTTFSYDSRSGLLTQVNDPGGITTKYGYAGNVPILITWSGGFSGSYSRKLDSDGRTASEMVNGSSSLEYGYDPSGQLARVGKLSFTRNEDGVVTHSIAGSVETWEEYDSNRQLRHVTTKAAGTVIFEQSYSRDNLRRIRAVAEKTRDGKTTSTEYNYDRAGRLVSVKANGRMAETDTYDSAGNRARIVRNGSGMDGTYDARDRQQRLGNVQYKWRADGQLESKTSEGATTRFQYDDLGALREVTLPNGTRVGYSIGAQGRRVARQVSGKTIAGYVVRPDGSIAAELDAAGKVVSQFAYDENGHLALIERAGASYRVITDSIGSPRFIVDATTGAVAAEMEYDAWGNVIRETNPGFIPFGFAGGLRDADTNLVRFGARDYDPAAGRWTAADPLRLDSGDPNLYRYAGDDPVNHTDRSGLDWFPHPVPGGLCTDDGWCHFAPPPGYGGEPPPNNNPGPANPPNPGGKPWQCSGVDCDGPSGSCSFGSCGDGPNGFWCSGVICDGPDRRCSFCSIGEPHLWSIDGGHFDFQAAGEFLAASRSDGKLIIQARQEPLAGSQVAVNTAVAVNVNGDVVGVYLKEPSFLLVNGRPIEKSDVEQRLPRGGRLQRHGGSVVLGWPEGDRLSIDRHTFFLNYNYVPGSNRARLAGMLGSSDADSLTARGGAVLKKTDPDFSRKLQREFGDSWRITQGESLFRYWPGENTAKFSDRSFPSKPASLASLSSADRSKSEAWCRAFGVHIQPALDDCTLDVGISGSPTFAASTALAMGGASASGRPATVAATTAAPAAMIAPSGRDEFGISIGDIVSPDHPATGAGKIDHAGQTQSYVFAADAGAIVYVKAGSCDGAGITLELQNGAKQPISGISSCNDFGPVTLPAAGKYRVVAKASHDGSTRYGFSLLRTTFDTFPVRVGDTISPDRPARGAGVIGKLGERQAYPFQATAGSIVYVKIGPCEGSPITFDLQNPTNQVVAGIGGCGSFGPVTLTSAGTYRVLVSADRATGVRYTFSLLPARVDKYSIRIGDTVSPDHPAAGAGIITEVGQRQSYAFQGKAGDAVYIGLGPCEGASPSFSLIQPDGGTLDAQTVNCHVDMGRESLPSTGIYRIVASTDQSNIKSRYGFFVHAVPTDKHFSLRLSMSMTSSSEHIEAAGTRHFYDFTAEPGMSVHIESECACAKLAIRAVAAGDTSRFAYFDLNSLSSDWVLPAGGKYSIQVVSNGFTGDYAFTAMLKPAHSSR